MFKVFSPITTGIWHNVMYQKKMQNRLIVPAVIGMATDLDEAWKVSSRPQNGTFCHLKLDISKEEYEQHG
jgi:hypothetical protein